MKIYLIFFRSIGENTVWWTNSTRSLSQVAHAISQKQWKRAPLGKISSSLFAEPSNILIQIAHFSHTLIVELIIFLECAYIAICRSPTGTCQLPRYKKVDCRFGVFPVGQGRAPRSVQVKARCKLAEPVNKFCIDFTMSVTDTAKPHVSCYRVDNG